MAEETYKPNQAMKSAAQQALDWVADGKKGGTDVGKKRARDIVAGRAMSLSTVKQMHAFFARHRGDKNTTGFNPGEEGYPSPGRVAWNLWGSDAGDKWSKAIVDKNRSDRSDTVVSDSREPNLPTQHVRAEIPMSEVEVRELESDDSVEFEGYGLRWSDEATIGYFFRFTERFQRGAFKKTISERGPAGNGQIKFLRQHNDRQSVGAKILELREDATGLWFKARTIGTDVGKNLAVELREGVVDTLSIGFDVIQENINKDQEPILRTVIEARLYEISAVLWPAYASATVEAVRALDDGALDQFMYQLEEEVRQGRTLSTENRSRLEQARDRIDDVIAEAGHSPASAGEPETESDEDSLEDRNATLDLELSLRERELKLQKG